MKKWHFRTLGVERLGHVVHVTDDEECAALAAKCLDALALAEQSAIKFTTKVHIQTRKFCRHRDMSADLYVYMYLICYKHRKLCQMKTLDCYILDEIVMTTKYLIVRYD